MNQITLTTVPVDTLETTLRQIIRSELAASKQKDVQDQMLSPKEACALFVPAISKTTLAKWTREGSLASYRIGGRVYYKHVEVVTALKELKRYRRN
jgi:hypothetical protein